MYTLKQVETWFYRALDQPQRERKHFLEKELEEDPRLLTSVLALLEAEKTDKSALTLLVDQMNLDLEVEEIPVLERYRVVDEIGRGGMSVVYLGERTDGLFEHQVAIKLLRSGMDSYDLLHIFERERNVLARLKHPHIAQIYDAGLTQKGRPFFVMELIEGKDLLSHLEMPSLSLPERLELFIQVCEAVHFAHQNTIVHRDIKPSNILIDKQGVVKLMDFGIAEIIEEDQVGNQEISNRILTPEYASPEQIKGDPIDVRSDIYQLGSMLGIITKEDQNSEVEAIVEKAAHQDKSVRYQSVIQLIQELRNKLEKRPVEAYNSGLTYKTRLYVQRNFWQVSIGVAALLLLAITSITYLVNINKARKEAEQKEFMASQSLEFLVDLFEQNDPAINQGEDVDIRMLLTAGERKINLLQDQQTKAAILNTLGRVNTSLGNFEKADALYRQSFDIYQDLENPAAKSEIQYNQGALEVEQGNYLEAKNYLLKALPALTSDYDKVHAYTLLAHVYRSTDLDSADLMKKVALELIASSKQLSKKDQINQAYDLAEIGHAKFSKEERDSLVIYKRGLVDELERVDPSDLVTLAIKYENLANTYENAMMYDSTLVYAKRSLKLAKKVYGNADIHITPSLYTIAAAFSWMADFDSAIHYLDKSLEIKTDWFGGLHYSQLRERKLKATMVANLGRHEEAEEIMRTNFSLSKEAYGLYHRLTGDNLYILLTRLNRRGKYEESVKLYPQLLKIDSASYGESTFSAASILNYGTTLRELGKKREALEKMEKALSIYKDKAGSDDFRYGMAKFEIGKTIKDTQPSSAISYMDSAVTIIENGMAKNHPRIAMYQREYAQLLAKEGLFHKSNKNYLKAIRIYEIAYSDQLQDRLAKFEEEYSLSLKNQGLLDSANHYMTRAQMNYALASADEAIN